MLADQFGGPFLRHTADAWAVVAPAVLQPITNQPDLVEVRLHCREQRCGRILVRGGAASCTCQCTWRGGGQPR